MVELSELKLKPHVAAPLAVVLLVVASFGVARGNTVSGEFGSCSLRCTDSNESSRQNTFAQPRRGKHGPKGERGERGIPGPGYDDTRLRHRVESIERALNVGSCDDLQGGHVSGVERVHVTGVTSPVHVYCDMVDEDGGWTVIQRRFDGSENFRRNFSDYSEGFGNAAGEHWLGLNTIHKMTKTGKWELKIDLEAFDESRAYARYSNFRVGRGPGFALKYEAFVGGSAGDSLKRNKDMKFSTFDNDQDAREGGNCAQGGSGHLGAWWWWTCGYSNLNAYTYRASPAYSAMIWHAWKGKNSLKASTMKIRPM